LKRLLESGSLNIAQRLNITHITTYLVKVLLHIPHIGTFQLRLKIQPNPSSKLVFNPGKPRLFSGKLILQLLFNLGIYITRMQPSGVRSSKANRLLRL
jgi:hypothetical protein